MSRKRTQRAPRPRATQRPTEELPTQPITAHVRVLEFDSTGLREIPALADYTFDAAKPGITWVSVTGIRHPELLRVIGERFGLHPLVLEDIANPEQRPKLEEYDDYVYIIVKAFAADGPDGADVRQVSLVLGQDFVISFQEEGETVLAPIDEQVRRDQGHIRAQGADRLLWALLDAVVDGYFGALEQLGEQIEELEERVAVNPEPDALEALHRNKRRLLRLRQAIWPMREVSSWLELTQSPLLSQATRLYFRDLHDHVVQAIDMVEISREVLSSILDIYVSSLSNRMNEIMKVLTIFSALFMPLTFIAGVYGMNFRYMPELSQRWAYPVVLAVMGAIFVTMLAYVRRRRWW